MSEPICNRVAIDLETTGLNPNAHSILEVGIKIYPPNMRGPHLFAGAFLVKYDTPESVDLERQRANAFVADMHTKNGLWKDLSEAAAVGMSNSWQRALPIDQLDALCAGIIERFAPEIPSERHPDRPEKPWAFGNNVESLDLPFLRAEMPKTAARLHYRSINVSGLRGIVLAETGRDYYDVSNLEGAAAKHRVLSDLDWSVNCYRWCVDVLRGAA